MIEVSDKPIATDKILARISSKDAGSVVVHIGIVKPVVDEKKTRGIRLTPDGDLEGELHKMERMLREKWEVTDILLIRRVGELRIGDVILVAAVAAPSREAAFGACREAVENFKQKRGIKKEELFEN